MTSNQETHHEIYIFKNYFTKINSKHTARFIKPYRDPVKHALDLGKVL